MSCRPITRHKPARRWLIRHGCGCIRELSSLKQLAALIVGDRLGPGAEISAGDGHWRRLDDVVDRRAFCVTLEALGHTGSRSYW